jgi:RNase H-fold protein (predicted Holliday junction resolvase)
MKELKELLRVVVAFQFIISFILGYSIPFEPWNKFAPNNGFEVKRVRIGIDYGPRFIGLAYSDYFGTVRPMYKVLHNRNNLTSLATYILEIAKNRGAQEIIVGLPLGPSSASNIHREIKEFNAQLCLNFSKVLYSVVRHKAPKKNIVVKLFDERFTTREAEMRLATKRGKGSIDAMAAACLLERYLEDYGEGAIESPDCPFPPPKELENFDYNLVKAYIRYLYYRKDMTENDVSYLQNLPFSDKSLLKKKQSRLSIDFGVISRLYLFHLYFISFILFLLSSGITSGL